MNTPHLPLNPELLDELLSADLDGEFDRAAADLGFTPAEARAAVDSTPGAAARRDALVHARDLLAAPPPLTAHDEERLVAHALQRADELGAARDRVADRRRRDTTWRALAAVGSAAAVVAVIIGLAASNPGTGSKSASDSPASEAASPTTPFAPTASPVEFGLVASADELRVRVQAALRTTTQQRSAADSAAPPTYGDSGVPGPQGASGAQGPAGATGPDGPSVTGATGGSGGVSVIAPQGPQTGVVNGKSVHGVDGLESGNDLLAMAAPRGLVGYDGVVVNAPAAKPVATAPTTLAPVTAPRCVAAAIRAAGPGHTAVVTGSATYAARPAAVVVLRGAEGDVAYVLAVPDCSVITHVVVS